MILMLFFVLLIYVFFIVVCFGVMNGKKKRLYDCLENVINNGLSVSPDDFVNLKDSLEFKNKNGPGVYILHNESKNMYYVGQGVQVFNRVNSHFTGKGNGDVYADYKYGDKFNITFVMLKNSEFDTLNELERVMIEHYDACDYGYNKTHGNK